MALVAVALVAVAACGEAAPSAETRADPGLGAAVSTTAATSTTSAVPPSTTASPTTLSPAPTSEAPTSTSTQVPDVPEEPPSAQELLWILQDRNDDGPFPDSVVRSRITMAPEGSSPTDSGDDGHVAEYHITTRGDVTVIDMIEDSNVSDDELTVRRWVEVASEEKGWELYNDGTWQSYAATGEGSDVMWLPFFGAWSDAQFYASSSYELHDVLEAVGWEDLAGRPAMHYRSESVQGDLHLWLDPAATVVGLTTSATERDEDTATAITTEWIVLEYDPEIEGPLPPGLGD